jgi:hypothetical protein
LHRCCDGKRDGPKDVLADLFSDPDFAVAILDPKRAADIVIRWLLAAGFEIIPARGSG